VFWPTADGVRGAALGLLAIRARIDERLAGYLQVVGLASFDINAASEQCE
jgi:hypothetical protein